MIWTPNLLSHAGIVGGLDVQGRIWNPHIHAEIFPKLDPSDRIGTVKPQHLHRDEFPGDDRRRSHVPGAADQRTYRELATAAHMNRGALMGRRRHEHSLVAQVLNLARVCPRIPVVQNYEIDSLTDLENVGVFGLYVPLRIGISHAQPLHPVFVDRRWPSRRKAQIPADFPGSTDNLPPEPGNPGNLANRCQMNIVRTLSRPPG
jgi:hypothetical protein